MSQEDNEDRIRRTLGQSSIENIAQERFRRDLRLEGEALEHQNRIREDAIKQSLAESAHVLLYVSRIIIPLAMGVLSWHYMLPKWLNWLSHDQLQGLLAFLGSVAIVGVVGAVYTYVRQSSRGRRNTAP